MKNKEFLTSREISEYLDIPLRTIQKLAQCGKIKGIKVGKQWRFKKYDIESYLAFGTDFSKGPVRIPNNFVERRAYPRINANLKCLYLINLLPFKNINREGIVKNIGAGGIFLFNQNGEADESAVDDPVYLQFQLISDTPQRIFIKAKGKIVWKNQEGIGIKFKNIDKGTKDILLEYTS